MLAHLVSWASVVLGLAGLLAMGQARPAAATTTALTLVEEAGVAREHAPARAAIPLLEGALRAPAGCMQGPAGPAPTELRILARWPDGSIRWLEARFAASIGAAEHQAWVFESTCPAPPDGGATMTVDEHDDRVDVATGSLHFSVRKDRFDPLANLVYDDAKPLAGPLATYLRTAPGIGGEAETPERVSVSERGARSAMVTLAGRHRGGFRYQLDLRVFAGEPMVEITYTFTNELDPLFTDVREIRFTLPLSPAPSRRYAAGIVGGRPIAARLDEHGFTLVQETESRFVAGERTGKQAAGWLDITGARRGVTLAATDFWQEYPKALRAATGTLTYDLWARESVRPAHIGTGAAKSQTFRLIFHSGSLSNPAIAALAAAAQTPLVALPTPVALATSAAVPNLPPPDAATRPLLAAFAASFDRYAKGIRQDRWNDSATRDCSGSALQRTGDYGMLNWGDWNFPRYMDRGDEGCETWGNLEYDLPQVLGLALLATGDRAYRPFFEAAARHFRDVDVIHYSKTHPDWVGMNHPHKPLHFSLEEPAGLDLGHTWAEGLFTHYYLTGEARSLATARGIADYLARVAGAHQNANPRQWGWPQIVLVSAYQATGEQHYLEAARRYAHGGMKDFAPSSTADDWKMGVLADGLSYVHAATGDSAIAAWILDYAAALAASPARFADIRYYPALAYAYHLSGREAYRAAAATALAQLRIGNWGKPLALNGRAAFRIAYLLGLPPRAGAAEAGASAEPTPVGSVTPAAAPTPSPITPIARKTRAAARRSGPAATPPAPAAPPHPPLKRPAVSAAGAARAPRPGAVRSPQPRPAAPAATGGAAE